MKTIDWTKVRHGAWFKADVRGKKGIVGRVSKDDNWVYLHQSERIGYSACRKGYSACRKFGFAYSWPGDSGFSNIRILPGKPKGFVSNEG